MDYIGDSATIQEADEEAAYYQETYGHEDTVPVSDDSDDLPY